MLTYIQLYWISLTALLFNCILMVLILYLLERDKKRNIQQRNIIENREP